MPVVSRQLDHEHPTKVLISRLESSGNNHMSFRYIGIDHVQLAAPAGGDDPARAFFGELLGMCEISKPANLAVRGGVWFQCGVHQLHIGVQPNFTPATKAHPAFEVEDLKALRMHLIANKVIIKDDEPLEGCHRFYVDDPFGNRIEFLERLTPRSPTKQ